ncbi:MAG: hypothetical protein B7Y08_29960 [Rhodospirillales bacterium 24-66-33]|jgi:hypothetical protein|nr:MAG: hypothetical protein B7Y57_29820 [Rhodospirillales bacterium 35-66-84]OYZ90410.1 MAG: hypothetical protein B7Y08_29960 [Rhodospirillales bacterium 24-66-33]OZB20793.1 MAG: hypothetical protein B7X63_29870 [Rhodospirillales bacterium 39-66-50]
MTHQIDAFRTILTDVHDILQQRFAAIGATETPYVLMAIGPDGFAIVRTNVDPEELKAMAVDLGKAADEAMQHPLGDEPLH